MCGIFGVLNSFGNWDKGSLRKLARHSQQRGSDSSGLLICDRGEYRVERADFDLINLTKRVDLTDADLVLGHSRLITNGLHDNQPVFLDGVLVFHNGIIVNHEELWVNLTRNRTLEIDTEIIAAIVLDCLDRGEKLEDIPEKILTLCKGVVSCAVVIPHLGKALLLSNNGSLYIGTKSDSNVFASEAFPLSEIGCRNVEQLKGSSIFDIPPTSTDITIHDKGTRITNLIPALPLNLAKESLLLYEDYDLRRCAKCILPETMPFIQFDAQGLCNYCANYKPRNVPRQREELDQLVLPYRRQSGNDCIVPFSGGRDSSYALHLIVNEMKMRPLTYTYDWGMVTDLGRRNISLMCGELGVENIIIAADISKKRRNIAKNLNAWLASPDLGMISILTAGDKHFFRYVDSVKKQTGIELNLWGINPLEVTHFKAGFLGMPPDFAEKNVYSSSTLKQIRYQQLRFKAMTKSPRYFNSSLWDTLSGEYWRSFANKSDYFHIFDYWRWDEHAIENTLDAYGWERAIDTKTTWRIGDGTAAFYNYVYYTVAGFTEHDTFRSNQIREGDLSRDEALALVANENQPRYSNIKWYLDALGMDYNDVVSRVNSIPKLIPE